MKSINIKRRRNVFNRCVNYEDDESDHIQRRNYQHYYDDMGTVKIINYRFESEYSKDELGEIKELYSSNLYINPL